MKLVFISMVTTPISKSTLRAAAAMVTSSRAIEAPPWVTPWVLRCSGPAVKRSSDAPSAILCRVKPRCLAKGMLLWFQRSIRSFSEGMGNGPGKKTAIIPQSPR